MNLVLSPPPWDPAGQHCSQFLAGQVRNARTILGLGQKRQSWWQSRHKTETSFNTIQTKRSAAGQPPNQQPVSLLAPSHPDHWVDGGVDVGTGADAEGSL